MQCDYDIKFVDYVSVPLTDPVSVSPICMQSHHFKMTLDVLTIILTMYNVSFFFLWIELKRCVGNEERYKMQIYFIFPQHNSTGQGLIIPLDLDVYGYSGECLL